MAIVCVIILRGVRFSRAALFVTLTALLILTAVFDNVIVGLDIVAYDSAKILGVYVGIAPIEDFIYAILAVAIVPAIWSKLGVNHAKS